MASSLMLLPPETESPSPASSIVSFPPEESIIQPGALVSDLPPQLEGTVSKIKRIGGGRHSSVYQGVWVRSSKDVVMVAIKCMRLNADLDDGRSHDQDRLVKRFTRETVVWQAAKHPNIVPFYGYQIVDKEPMLVSPWCENGNLSTFLCNSPSLTDVDKLKLLCDAARGLAHLHSLDPPVAHGDIKPENILITDEGHGALCDFGHSRLMIGLNGHTGLTTGGQGAEWAGYQAKELYDGYSRPTSMSDVFSFGGLILTIMSGKPPFYKSARMATAAVVIAIYRDETPNPKDHPELLESNRLWFVMRKCWSPRPEDRPTALDVINDLDISSRSELQVPDSPRSSVNPLIATSGSNEASSSSFTEKSLHREGSLLSPSLEESILQSGVQVPELQPQLEGVLSKIEKIGTGGYGDVYQGVWTRSSDDPDLRRVAIKSIRGGFADEESENQSESERLLTRIKRETAIWKDAAKHPNILPFYGYQIIDAEPMLVSPWCKNGNLAAYIRKHVDLTDCDKLKLLCDAARGLAHLHSLQRPIAHGDIKPENVIITDEHRGALCDFGISRVMTSFRTGYTTVNQAAGTTRYQAKELSLGQTRPTDKSDVYAFGGLILATMSGKPPFHQHKSAPPIILAINEGQMPIPAEHPGLPEADPLWALLRRCWDPIPTRRPSIHRIIAELEVEIQRRSAQGPCSTSGPQPQPTPPPSPGPKMTTIYGAVLNYMSSLLTGWRAGSTPSN